MKFVAALMLGLSFAAAARAAETDMETEKAELLRTDREFSDAAQKLGVGEAFLRYADENATMLPAGEDAVTGLDAVKDQFSDYPKGATLVWKPVKAEVSQSGDLGYTIGTYEARGPDPDGRFVTHYGKYCSVWKKQKDGGWKWVVDVGTPSSPPRN